MIVTSGLAPSRVTALTQLRASLSSSEGEVWECGVYLGNNAVLLHDACDGRMLRLFDTFDGCPDAMAEDFGVGSRVRWGWPTTLDEVRRRVSGDNVFYHPGLIPDSFIGLEDAEIAFVYLDLTLYAGTKGALEFIYPRLAKGGAVFVRDYAGSKMKWPGLVRAVDEFIALTGAEFTIVEYDALIAGPA